MGMTIYGNICSLTDSRLAKQWNIPLYPINMSMGQKNLMGANLYQDLIISSRAWPITVSSHINNLLIRHHGQIFSIFNKISRMKPAIHFPCQLYSPVHSHGIAMAVTHYTYSHCKYSFNSTAIFRKASPRWLMACFSSKVSSAMDLSPT